MSWADAYAQGITPWDLGCPHPELQRRLQAGLLRAADGTRRVLVPGCGRGHDALALADAGYTVTGVDIVAELSAVVGPALEDRGGRLVLADALALDEPYDLLFEHTFFCALDPALRPQYGQMAARCIVPGGMLHAVVFPLDKTPADQGPPFQMAEEHLVGALGKAFEVVESAPIDPLPNRPWAASWLSARRR